MKFNEIIGDENEGTMRYKNLSTDQAKHLLQLRSYAREEREKAGGNNTPIGKILTNVLTSVILIAEDE